jgi:hypothetical protein
MPKILTADDSSTSNCPCCLCRAELADRDTERIHDRLEVEGHLDVQELATNQQAERNDDSGLCRIVPLWPYVGQQLADDADVLFRLSFCVGSKLLSGGYSWLCGTSSFGIDWWIGGLGCGCGQASKGLETMFFYRVLADPEWPRCLEMRRRASSESAEHLRTEAVRKLMRIAKRAAAVVIFRLVPRHWERSDPARKEAGNSP